MNLKDRKVRILIDKHGVLIRAGDPSYTDKSIEKEMLQNIKDGGEVRIVTYDEYKGMKLYEKVPNLK